MADALRHRGPDDGRAWADVEAGIALAHRRLAIIDLTEAGAQPMHSASGRLVIVYNGEIYNFRELRRALDREGRPVRGGSDTAVLLEAIEAWGLEETLHRAAGMFAFALWDRTERTLTLARDRVGEKPLYFGVCGAGDARALLFGSELKALRAHPAFDRPLDRRALSAYFGLGYIPAPLSIHEHVFKLPPATFLTLRAADLAGPLPRPTVYWSMRAAAIAGRDDPFTGSMDEAADELERILSRVVEEQMIADVPLGAFLSGGIDSSTVVALMQARSARPVRTFTVGFGEKEFNEAEHARAVARHLGTAHTDLTATPDDALRLIPDLPRIWDEPFADYSAIPTHLVAALTRRHVTVSLSADGGDEFFAGYRSYFWVRALWRRIGALPAPARRAFALLKLLPPRAWDALGAPFGGGRRTGHRVHLLAEVLRAQTPEELFVRLTGHWRKPGALVLGGEAPDPSMPYAFPDETPAFDHYIPRLQYCDSVRYLPDDILAKVDRAAMAVSLESRAPLIDHRVVEFAWRLPLNLKVAGDADNDGKQVLRRLLYRHVPRELVDRPKMGFTVPLADWLRGPLRDWAEDLLDERRLREDGFLRPTPILTRWREHVSGGRDWKHVLWDVLMFQAWLRHQRP
jgi:asparagine synthase (glutamine-hydrolysing)